MDAEAQAEAQAQAQAEAEAKAGHRSMTTCGGEMPNHE